MNSWLDLISLVSFLFILLIKATVVFTNKLWVKSGRAVSLWMLIYLIFIFIVSLSRRTGYISLIAGQTLFSSGSIIVLLGMVSHLFFKRQIDDGVVDVRAVEKIKLEGEVIKKK